MQEKTPKQIRNSVMGSLTRLCESFTLGTACLSFVLMVTSVRSWREDRLDVETAASTSGLQCLTQNVFSTPLQLTEGLFILLKLVLKKKVIFVRYVPKCIHFFHCHVFRSTWFFFLILGKKQLVKNAVLSPFSTLNSIFSSANCCFLLYNWWSLI